ncbi:hypothetical protein [Novosphingobium sp.]|uniref:hypothetical protein n=1 Tax=Novosphingobium sp. TaxID=1874826 RepID=UPI0031E45AD0
MTFALPALGAALIGTAATAITTALVSKPSQQVAVQQAQPVTVRQNSAVADAITARRGSAANMRTGSGGAEASTGLKTKLGA